MKKLMIAAAIVCAAAFAQAAAVGWNMTGAYDPVSGDELGDVEGFYAYILVDSVTAGSTTTYSFTDAKAAVNSGNVAFLEKALDHQEVSYGAGSEIDLALNNTAKAYLVIVDAEDFAEATKAYIVDATQTVSVNGVGPEGDFDFGMLGDTANPDMWHTVGAAPEPTSGLLLLLGVAGLALRRRRA